MLIKFRYFMRYVLMVCFLLHVIFTFGQNAKDQNYPAIGKLCPEFSFNDVYFYTKKAVTLNDFKGKWLVLDFFSAGCLSCFESFPKMNQLRSEFNNQMEFILIGYGDQDIKKIYDTYQRGLKLELPVAYNNDIFFKYGVSSVPHVVIIDDKGIVRAITSSITRNSIESFLSGSNPVLSQKLNVLEEKTNALIYDSKKPLFINGNGGNDTAFLFRSILTEWKNNIIGLNQQFISATYFKNRVQVVCQSISDLYKIAYTDTIFPWPDLRGSSYGHYWRWPILEVKDSMPFQIDKTLGKNLYNYSLIVPSNRATSKFLKKNMQRDLENYFGYNVKIETRQMPYWSVIASNEAKIRLISKSAISEKKKYLPRTGFSLANVPMWSLIHQLFLCFQNESPFIDETGIEKNIDIEVDAILTDFDQMKNALEKKGIYLIKKYKDMNVIVIRDKDE